MEPTILCGSCGLSARATAFAGGRCPGCGTLAAPSVAGAPAELGAMPSTVASGGVLRAPSGMGPIQNRRATGRMPGVVGMDGISRIGPYEVLRRIGQGTFGAVYEVRREGSKHLALKLLMAGTAQDEARFLRETELMRRVDHPGVVKLLDAGKLGLQPWFVMELCPGENLKERLRRGALDPAEAARLLREIAQAVAAVHAQGIVHRDLKPSNVILEPGTLRPRVTDFGLARGLGTGSLTRSGDGLGTPLYMAPELFKDAKHAGPAADVWALGVILYECLTGRTPFLAEEWADLALCAQEVEPPRPSLSRPSIAPALDTACMAALVRDPARRPDALTFAQSLQVPSSGSWPVLSPAYTASQRFKATPARRGGRSQAVLVGGAALSLLLFAGSFVVLFGGGGDEPATQAAAPPTSASPAPPVTPEPVAPVEEPGREEPGDALAQAERELSEARDPAVRATAARRVLNHLQLRGRERDARARALELAAAGDPFAPEARLRAAVIGQLRLGQDARAELEQVVAAAPDALPGVVAAALLRSPWEASLLQRAIEMEPDLALPRWLLVELLLAGRRGQEAVQELEEGLRRAPDDRDLLWTRAHLLIGRDPVAASLELERLIELGGDQPDVELLYQRARMDMHRNDWRAARENVGRYLERRPGDLVGLLLRGRAHWELGERERSEADYAAAALQGGEAFQREVERRYRNEVAQIWTRAVAGLRLAPFPLVAGPELQASLEARLQRVPPAAREPLRAALLAGAAGQPWEAQAASWDEVRRLAPASVEAALLEARAQLGRDRQEEALACLDRARTLGPEPQDELRRIDLEAAVIRRSREPAKADEALRALRERDPQGPFGLRAAAGLAPAPEATAIVEAALRRFPRDPGLLLAGVEAHLGKDPLRSLALADAALAVDGATDVQLLLGRARAWAELAGGRGAWERLGEEAERPLQVVGDSARILILCADLLLRSPGKADAERAERHLRRVTEAEPELAYPWRLIGLARLRMDQPAAEVRRAWDRALELGSPPIPKELEEELRRLEEQQARSGG